MPHLLNQKTEKERCCCSAPGCLSVLRSARLSPAGSLLTLRALHSRLLSCCAPRGRAAQLKAWCWFNLPFLACSRQRMARRAQSHASNAHRRAPCGRTHWRAGRRASGRRAPASRPCAPRRRSRAPCASTPAASCAPAPCCPAAAGPRSWSRCGCRRRCRSWHRAATVRIPGACASPWRSPQLLA